MQNNAEMEKMDRLQRLLQRVISLAGWLGTLAWGTWLWNGCCCC